MLPPTDSIRGGRLPHSDLKNPQGMATIRLALRDALQDDRQFLKLPHLLRLSYTRIASYPSDPILLPIHNSLGLRPLVNTSAIASLSSRFSDIRGYLSSLWDSILLAVPKKKPSKAKSKSKRHHGGKAEKDVQNLNRCSGCGRVKRAHVLCPYCVQSKLLSLVGLQRAACELRRINIYKSTF